MKTFLEGHPSGASLGSMLIFMLSSITTQDLTALMSGFGLLMSGIVAALLRWKKQKQEERTATQELALNARREEILLDRMLIHNDYLKKGLTLPESPNTDSHDT